MKFISIYFRPFDIDDIFEMSASLGSHPYMKVIEIPNSIFDNAQHILSCL